MITKEDFCYYMDLLCAVQKFQDDADAIIGLSFYGTLYDDVRVAALRLISDNFGLESFIIDDYIDTMIKSNKYTLFYEVSYSSQYYEYEVIINNHADFYFFLTNPVQFALEKLLENDVPHDHVMKIIAHIKNTTVVQIPIKELIDMKADSLELAALEADGVDNWEWYSVGFHDFLRDCFAPDVSEDFLREATFEDAARYELGIE